MDPLRLLIIGASLRGTILLERLLAARAALPATSPIELIVADPFPPGSGRIWRAGQDHRLVMNTVPAQSTVFPDASVTVADSPIDGPSFAVWCQSHADAVVTEPQLRRELAGILPWSSPSRALYGEYLRWAWTKLLDAAPASVTIRHLAERITRLEPRTGGGYLGRGADGTEVEADAVFLAVGWLPAAPSDADAALWGGIEEAGGTVLRPDNPIDQRVDLLKPEEQVLIRGLGMSFFDVLSLATEARGGVHTADGYLPSGREPRFLASSRRGIPFQAKPDFGGVPPAPAQRHLRAAVAALLPRVRSGSIDFGTEVRPAIDADATHDYYATLARVRPTAFARPVEELLAAVGRDNWAERLAAAVPDPADRLDLDAMQHPHIPEFSGPDEADAWVASRVREDVEQAALGLDSPRKVALWSIGAARSVVIPLVDFGGLTVASARGAYAEFSAFAGFLASGPPLFRSRQLLAVHDAGLVRFLGPGARLTPAPGGLRAEVAGASMLASALVEARLDLPGLRRSADPLLTGLLADGLARPHRNEIGADGGIDIDPDTGGVMRADGSIATDLYSVGLPSEDARVFTIIAPIPGANSPVIREIDQAVRAALAALASATATATAGRTS